MARGWHYTKLSLSSAFLFIFFWHVYFVVIPCFLSFSFVFSCVFSCSRWSSLLSVLLSCDKGGLQKNQKAPRPSEHPRVSGKKMSKRLAGIIGCKYKTSSWQLNECPDGSNIGPRVYGNVEEEFTAIPYTYINRHARTPEKR